MREVGSDGGELSGNVWGMAGLGARGSPHAPTTYHREMTRRMAKKENQSISVTIEEDRHWWFAGRTWTLRNMLDRVVRPDGARRVLDVGCGAGNMFHHLAPYGPVVGLDNNPKPLAVARQRGYTVYAGLADRLPFGDGSFDLVSLLDTLEHCDDDMAVLRECYRVCAPGGHLVLTVPAFMALWSHNDELNLHRRRYTAGEVGNRLRRIGFWIRRRTYNNFILFPPAAAVVLLRRMLHRKPELGSPHFDDDSYQVEMEPAPPALNAILTAVTWSEAQVLRWLSLPLGTSILCIAEKPAV